MSRPLAVEPQAPPHIPEERLRSGVLAGAAGLMGFGLILFVAANWDVIGRFQRFGLVAAVIAIGALAATASSLLRIPGLLLATAGTGGMLALIGQTYQTGADPWQLFALWAALALPWAIAARSDALWTPWSLISMTAISLWYQAVGAADLGWFTPAGATQASSIAGVPVTVLTSWILSLALAASMCAWPPLENWLGERRWAFRLSLSLTIILVASHAVATTIAWPAMRLETYFVAVVLLAGIATWLATSTRRDIMLIAAAALAIDVTLIAGFVRALLPSLNRADFGIYIVIGLVAAAIVAVSVVAIMRLVRTTVAAPGEATTTAVRSTIDGERPWPVIVLSGLGAFLAAIPFIVATGLFLERALSRGPTTYVIAAVILPVAIYTVRKALSLFVEQLAIVGLATGLLLLGWSLFRDLPAGMAGLTCGLIGLSLAICLGRTWLAALLGAASTVGFAIAVLSVLPVTYSWRSASTYGAAWSLIALAGLAAGHAQRTGCAGRGSIGNLVIAPNDIAAALTGWIAASLAALALSSGDTFLLAAHMGPRIGADSRELAPQMLTAARGLSFVVAALASYALAKEMPSLRSPLALALLATATALSMVMPALGATIAVLAFAMLTGRRVVAVAAVAGVLWIVGAFYYTLALPLTHKAAILTASGAVLAIAALASGAKVGGLALPAALAPDAPASMLPRALVMIGLVATVGISAEAIRAKEALIRDGAPVFVELVPVDPRSLMQGDYMALRFQLPAGITRQQIAFGMNPVGIGKRDEHGILRVTRIGNPQTSLEAGEIKIKLQMSGGRLIIVTNAWFFKEGTAAKWSGARFGEFRVLPDGSALLVGLADKDRARIE